MRHFCRPVLHRLLTLPGSLINLFILSRTTDVEGPMELNGVGGMIKWKELSKDEMENLVLRLTQVRRIPYKLKRRVRSCTLGQLYFGSVTGCGGRTAYKNTVFTKTYFLHQENKV